MNHSNSAQSVGTFPLSFESMKKEFKLDFLMSVREPAFVLPTLLFPMMFYLFFGLLFGKSGLNGQMPTFLMVTYGVFGIMSPALFGFGVSVALERDKGWMAIKQVTPMPPLQLMLAKMTNAMTFASIIIICLFFLGAVFGNVLLTKSQWLSLAATLLIGTLPFCALGMAVGFWVKGNAAVAVVNLIYLPTAFLSGLAIPINYFPNWLQQVAHILPPFHLSQLGLKIIDMDLGGSTFTHLGALVLATCLFLFIALTGYKRSQSE